MVTNGIRTSGKVKLISVLAGACAALLATAMPVAANPKLVVDVSSLKVYEQQDIYQKWYPASLTKLMTAYTTFRALKSGQLTLESPVVMSKNAAGEPPSKMFYKPGQAVTLDSALKMLLIKSANDIAVAIGETVAGSEPAFVNLMNAEAKRIGMTSVAFHQPERPAGRRPVHDGARSCGARGHHQARVSRNAPPSPMKASPRARRIAPISTC